MKTKFLVLGGAGFVGSALARALRAAYPRERVAALDNLKRRGSELNIPLLQEAGVDFIHGDIRCPEDLEAVAEVEWILDCSAEPSVLAGLDDPRYVIHTNLDGTVNALELARRRRARFVLLSTSRVYPISLLESLPYRETATRFEWAFPGQRHGVSRHGVSEQCPLSGVCSLYGATKRASEQLVQEYAATFGVEHLINRFGVIAGPGQFGKSDQGIFTHWLIAHWLGLPLAYLGYGGNGKQVRDLLHIADVTDLILLQLQHWKRVRNQIFNAGGGRRVSASLLETTRLCEEITARRLPIRSVRRNRPNDLRIYLTDHRRLTRLLGWKPSRDVRTILADTHRWLLQNEREVKRWIGAPRMP